MKNNVRTMLIVSLLAAIFMIAGCDTGVPASQTPPADQGKVSGQTAEPNTLPGGQKVMQLVVYQATKDAMFLVPEMHNVPVNSRPARTAMELLLAGPKNTELAGVMPAGTKLRDLQIKGHIAYVDFSDALIKKNSGGSAGEILLVGAIVNTLTEFPDIQQVQILVDGRKIDTISGHMDLGEPLSRSEKIIKK